MLASSSLISLMVYSYLEPSSAILNTNSCHYKFSMAYSSVVLFFHFSFYFFYYRISSRTDFHSSVDWELGHITPLFKDT